MLDNLDIVKVQNDMNVVARSLVNPRHRVYTIPCYFLTTQTKVFAAPHPIDLGIEVDGGLGLFSPGFSCGLYAFKDVVAGSVVSGTHIAANSIATIGTGGISCTLSKNTTGSVNPTAEALNGAQAIGAVAIVCAALTAAVAKGSMLVGTFGIAYATADALINAVGISCTPLQHAGITTEVFLVYPPTSIAETLTFKPIIGTGNGVLKTFTTTLNFDANECITPKSIWIQAVGDTEVLHDKDGDGILYSSNVLLTGTTALPYGSIDYMTGIITANFYTAVTNAAVIACDYHCGKFYKSNHTPNEAGFYYTSLMNGERYRLDCQLTKVSTGLPN